MNRGILPVFITVLFLLAIAIIPCPVPISYLKPAGIPLFVLFLELITPNFFSLLFVVMLGLSLDVLLATVMGEHVFALALITWLASSKSRRFHLFTIPQQSTFIGLMICIYQSILLIIENIQGNPILWGPLLGIPVVSALIWPWFKFLMLNIFSPRVRA